MGRQADLKQKILGSYNAKLISSILISQMIDENKSEENRLLFPLRSEISQHNSYHIKQSTTNHISDNINRAFTLLPRNIEIQTSLDKSIHKTNQNPTERKQWPYMKKGFSSITITARKAVSSSDHALKEIASDPASSVCRSNDLVMKLPISSVEHDQQYRHFDSQEYYTHSYTRDGVCSSRQHPKIVYPDLISNTEYNHNRLNIFYKNRNDALFISYVHMKPQQCLYTIILYVDRSISLPVGRFQMRNERICKAEISFKISSANSTACREFLKLPRLATVKNDMAVHREINQLHEVRNILALKQNVRTECYTSSEGLSQMSLRTDISTEIQDIKNKDCNDGQVLYKSENRGLNKVVSKYGNVKDSDVQKVIQKGIYLQRNNPQQPFCNFVSKRSSTTRFNYIFGKQISKNEKEKQKMHKENVPPNDWKRENTYGKPEPHYNVKMQLPTVFEISNVYIKVGQFTKNMNILQDTMSLKEALELNRPDFISNSQKRVLKLELMAQNRKTQLNNELPTLQRSHLQTLPPRITSSKRKIFTVPNPLSVPVSAPFQHNMELYKLFTQSDNVYLKDSRSLYIFQ